MHRLSTCLASACAGMFLPTAALAATYTVGPSGRDFTQLSALVDNTDLEPGDLVLVDGGTTYSGNIIVRSGDRGAPGNPVTFRWNRSVGATRPILQGGSHTIKFQQSNHVVFEGFDVRGGTSSCLFSEADDVTVRDTIIRDCPSHGILGADNNSGSFTLEYSEVYNSGADNGRHSIYMQSDEVAYPGSVFRMRYNYIHSQTGGVLVRVRHERSEIYYNWIEGHPSKGYMELELIGPDCETQQPGWSADLRREDADVVGNVIVHNNPGWRHAVRIGGDLNGRNQGRVRMVNNTLLFTNSGQANAVLVQLGAGSLEMHNNVVYQVPAGSTPAIVRENPASEVSTPYCGPQSREPWTDGRKVAGSNNWVQASAQLVPSEWTGTLRGGNPMLSSVAQLQLRPRASSPLVSAGNPQPVTPPGFPFPSPLLLPRFDPPLRAKMAIGAEVVRSPGARVDIGALESTSGGSAPIPMNGAQPLIPPSTVGSAAPAPAFPRAGSRSQRPSTGTAGVATAGNRGAGRLAAANPGLQDETVRLTPPILRLWARLSRWFRDLATQDDPAAR